MHQLIIKFSIISSILAGVVLLTSCALLEPEGEYKGPSDLCIAADRTVSQLQAGPEKAKPAAKIIEKHSKDPEMKRLASKISQGLSTQEDRRKITAYIKDVC